MNPSIHIDIHQQENQFLLRGEIQDLLKKRRAKIYLKDYLDAKFYKEEIRIDYNNEDKELVLKHVRQLLRKFGFQEETSVAVKETLADFFQEEQNFEIFSRYAYKIRNNQLDQDQIKEFEDFSRVLLKALRKRRLYPLQLLSAYHLAFSQNACNFSVPGSGKTSIVYGAYAYLKSLPKDDPKHVDRILIVGPLSSFGPWETEYRECFGQEPHSKRLSGGVSRKERVRYFYSSRPAEISLISYNGVPNMLEDIKLFLKKHKCMVVLDEAHRIKNTEGGVFATSALELAKYSKSRVILTGTPAPNGYEDIFNLFKFIWPTKDVIKFPLYQLEDMSSNPNDPRVNRLIDDISPYFIRIRKSDLNLPEPIEYEPVWVDMGPVQDEIYRYIEKNYMDYFLSRSKSSGLHSLLTRARLIRLMQVSTNPALLQKPLDDYFLNQGITSDAFIDDSAIMRKIVGYGNLETPKKFEVVAKLTEDIIERQEKVIVWAIFVQTLHDLQDYLGSKGIDSRLLYGATPIETGLSSQAEDFETREKIISEFHKTNCPYKVIIANPFAVSESISLHKACHNAIYLERSFNAASFIQSKDRIHRVGLEPEDEVKYYYILSKNNVDLTIHERLKAKEERMLGIIESEPIPLFRRVLGDDEEIDDIRALIENYVNQTVAA
ncbi:MAG: ATP-dependent helicase [Chloroflexi bacterium]|nr:MAG: ATP-dependent helicase [Chloroflexota bacterium]RLC82709.1 MAG: ATP-dependent helicase [Chloroflexota bacterium]